MKKITLALLLIIFGFHIFKSQFFYESAPVVLNKDRAINGVSKKKSLVESEDEESIIYDETSLLEYTPDIDNLDQVITIHFKDHFFKDKGMPSIQGSESEEVWLQESIVEDFIEDINSSSEDQALISELEFERLSQLLGN